MNKSTELCSNASTDELSSALEDALSKSMGVCRRIRHIARRPFPFASSFPLEDLRIEFETGGQLSLLFKDLSFDQLNRTTLNAKPQFLYDPLREIDVYESILKHESIGTAFCYGSFVDARSGRYWLFLEKVAGRELYQIGEPETWSLAARWLARLHHRFGELEYLPQRVHHRLIRFDAEYYGRWFERAAQFERRNRAAPAANIHKLKASAVNLTNELTALPVSLIHGEFYASNVLIQETSSGPRVCPVDWERAAIGPPMIDLAALSSGKWTEEQKQMMLLAYRDELQHIGAPMIPYPEHLRQLDICRLHLAIQWLGWSREWLPPRAHRQDWLAECMTLAGRIGNGQACS